MGNLRHKIQNNYLVFKMPSHNYFYFYTESYKYFKDLKEDNFYLFFSPATNWNDYEDIKQTLKKEKDKDSYIYFYRCLSYFKTESIAMWNMYAKNGVCFKVSKCPIYKLEELAERVELCTANGDTYSIETNDVHFNPLQDVIYYNRNCKKKSVFVMRSIHGNNVTLKAFNDLENEYYFKDIGWSYECECRLSIAIPNLTMQHNNNIVGVKVYLKNDKRYKKECIKSPFLKKPIKGLNIKVTKSIFEGKINFK